MKDLNEFLKPEVRKEFILVSASTGKPVQTSGPIFAAGAFKSYDATQMTLKTMEALYKQKHPMVRKVDKKEDAAPVAAKK
jgi:hypothetical protein